MTRFTGLTWDHDRGWRPLEAAAARAAEREDVAQIEWSKHSLEGFESAPIDELLAEYDVIVLDHPHLGDAIESGQLRPLEEVFDAAFLDSLESVFVGPSLASYRVAGQTWALPLDAASQVAARRPDLHADRVRSWDEVRSLATSGRVALSLSGPHALLSFFSSYRGLAGRVDFGGGSRGGVISDVDAAIEILSIFQEIYANRAVDYAELNPIGLLELMTSGDSIAYVPHVYGYVNYSADSLGSPVTFEDVPRFAGHGYFGSTIGGTGLGISRKAELSDGFVNHLKWLVSDETQRGFIPAHCGQPARLSAWQDEQVNAASGGFYRNTLATLEDSWVRPRFPSYPQFQEEGSEIFRRAVIAGTDPREALQQFEEHAEQYSSHMSERYA